MRTILVLIGLSGCAGRTERVLARQGDPAAGAEVFAERCSGCHGDRGQGGSGPALQGEDDTPGQLADKILWGWGAMDGLAGDLSIRETADVIAFVLEEIQQY